MWSRVSGREFTALRFKPHVDWRAGLIASDVWLTSTPELSGGCPAWMGACFALLILAERPPARAQLVAFVITVFCSSGISR